MDRFDDKKALLSWTTVRVAFGAAMGPAEVTLEGTSKCASSVGRGWLSMEMLERPRGNRGPAKQLAASVRETKIRERRYIVGVRPVIVMG